MACMKPRHVAALALVGWYLMMAPMDREGKATDPSAPLSQWQHLSSYDSAQDCERVRLPTMNKTCKAYPASCENLSNNLLCISTDDPRLKNN